MAKLWGSYLIGLMKLAIVLSLAAFPFDTAEQTPYFAAFKSASFVATAHDCVNGEEKESDHHNGEHGSRTCCGEMCSALAVLTDIAKLADEIPATIHPLVVWSEPDSCFPPDFYRPPIA
ncbi:MULTISPECIES: hypothetical protein [Sinorhizobium/Ensifer group]|uniref:DUF2946 domain-containing protein n=1 Tax=Sinorhizobium sp. M14 TaxID=430451 RepID=A0A142BPR4_9HYPH|nr:MULTISPECIES: hypothetical protein [Sinorhizobium/Ensifer group]AMP35072.1 hypothetical protein pSinB_213 [Sinorhizobium sp. M14]